MAKINLKIPGINQNEFESPIVIIGPNGSGKTKFAQTIANNNQISSISAQRRTWIDDSLPVQEEKQLKTNVRHQMDRWKQQSWQPTEEINWVLSTLIQEHTKRLTKLNEEALLANSPLDPVRDTQLMKLQSIWGNIFPFRKLEIGGFFPKVKRLDMGDEDIRYSLREMSDGERTVLYMAARVLTAEHQIILVDEPELHMHSRLSVEFWNEAEKIWPDRGFIYVTHDLNFGLSRRNATFIILRSNNDPFIVPFDQIPSSIAKEILGVATLPFHAQRIFLYEGEAGKGFASEFFDAWFSDEKTFAIPIGNRSSVCQAAKGLKSIGVVSADIIGIIDRDFYSDDELISMPENVLVLKLHEIESVICVKSVISAIAEHLGKNSATVWDEFVGRVKQEFTGRQLNHIVANRVRNRIGDLLNHIFDDSQIHSDLNHTIESHASSESISNLPSKIRDMFKDENMRVMDAINSGDNSMLSLLPGKHLLSIISNILGMKNSSDLSSLVTQSLTAVYHSPDLPIALLGRKIEVALSDYLPSRCLESAL